MVGGIGRMVFGFGVREDGGIWRQACIVGKERIGGGQDIMD